jgi:hypothetical protein
VVRKIDPNQVEQVFRGCLFRDDELAGGRPDNVVAVDGVVAKFGLHPGRLEASREVVKNWLLLLPKEFRKDSGGGWSFLNACVQDNGEEWTSLHQRMEQLFVLGIGLKMVRLLTPKDTWRALPGGMPYFVVDLEEEQ